MLNYFVVTDGNHVFILPNKIFVLVKKKSVKPFQKKRIDDKIQMQLPENQ